jgi:hypothetical protein
MEDRFNEFRMHLVSDKFQGYGQDGMLNSMIQCNDVQRWLNYIQDGRS